MGAMRGEEDVEEAHTDGHNDGVEGKCRVTAARRVGGDMSRMTAVGVETVASCTSALLFTVFSCCILPVALPSFRARHRISSALVVDSLCCVLVLRLFFFCLIVFLFFFFFFSSRRRHTRCLSDWSSDVCSSD